MFVKRELLCVIVLSEHLVRAHTHWLMCVCVYVSVCVVCVCVVCVYRENTLHIETTHSIERDHIVLDYRESTFYVERTHAI